MVITVSCSIFPSILIAKNLLTGSLKNRSIDNLETQKKSISMKNEQLTVRRTSSFNKDSLTQSDNNNNNNVQQGSKTVQPSVTVTRQILSLDSNLDNSEIVLHQSRAYQPYLGSQVTSCFFIESKGKYILLKKMKIYILIMYMILFFNFKLKKIQIRV
jgi:hypothetical protein